MSCDILVWSVWCAVWWLGVAGSGGPGRHPGPGVQLGRLHHLLPPTRHPQHWHQDPGGYIGISVSDPDPNHLVEKRFNNSDPDLTTGIGCHRNDHSKIIRKSWTFVQHEFFVFKNIFESLVYFKGSIFSEVINDLGNFLKLCLIF